MTTGMWLQQLFHANDPNLLNGVAEPAPRLQPEPRLFCEYSSFDRILLCLWDVRELIAAFSLNQWFKEKSSTAEYTGIPLRHRRS